MMKITEDDLDVLARTIFGEARCEYGYSQGGMASLIAVGNVIMNRSKSPKRFGRTLKEVCLRPWQFSCWNENDPVRKTIEGVGPQADPVFGICRDVAIGVALQNWPDLTKGSDHYHANYCHPKWADPERLKVKLGRHIFYRLG